LGVREANAQSTAEKAGGGGAARGNAERGSAQPDSGQSSADGNDSAAHREHQEEIVITGTHIHGEAPVGTNVLTITRDNMEKSGFATLQDVLKILPQNAGASVTDLQGSDGNFTHETGVNLRGLGVGATLTLVNGRRQPASGNGDFVALD